MKYVQDKAVENGALSYSAYSGEYFDDTSIALFLNHVYGVAPFGFSGERTWLGRLFRSPLELSDFKWTRHVKNADSARYGDYQQSFHRSVPYSNTSSTLTGGAGSLGLWERRKVISALGTGVKSASQETTILLMKLPFLLNKSSKSSKAITDVTSSRNGSRMCSAL